jgi:plastocyanin
MSRFARAALILALLAAGACGGGGSDDEPTAAASTTTAVTADIGGTNAVVRGTSVAAEGLEVEIDDNYFKPNVLLGTAGQKVTLELASEGSSLHNFSLTDQGISQDVPAGTNASVKVTFPASGELVFFCKYHKDESAMVGALRVSS